MEFVDLEDDFDHVNYRKILVVLRNSELNCKESNHQNTIG